MYGQNAIGQKPGFGPPASRLPGYLIHSTLATEYPVTGTRDSPLC